MKIKKGAKLNEDCDFWYDLTDGGYIKPEQVLENQSDIEKVLEAIEIIRDFEQSYFEACDEQEEE